MLITHFTNNRITLFFLAFLISTSCFNLTGCAKKESPLSNTSASPEELSVRFLTALEKKDEPALSDLRVTELEYKTIIWPPYEKIGTGPADFSWSINVMDAHKAIQRALSDYGGRKLEFVKVYFGKGKDQKVGDFVIWRDCRIVAKNEQGEEEVLTFINTVVEMYGRYKVVAFHS